MALMKAKEACYLGEAGFKDVTDGPFEYKGPKHDSLIPAKAEPANDADSKQ